VGSFPDPVGSFPDPVVSFLDPVVSLSDPLEGVPDPVASLRMSPDDVPDVLRMTTLTFQSLRARS
jgi:hypothetical protein